MHNWRRLLTYLLMSILRLIYLLTIYSARFHARIVINFDRAKSDKHGGVDMFARWLNAVVCARGFVQFHLLCTRGRRDENLNMIQS